LLSAREPRPVAYGAGEFLWGTHIDLPAVCRSHSAPEPSEKRARAENLRLKTLPSGKSPRPARCPQAEDGIIAREDLPLHELFFVLQTEKQLFSYFSFGYNHIWNIIPTT